MSQENFSAGFGALFGLLVLLIALFFPIFIIYFSTQFLLGRFSELQVFLIWSILIVVCLTLWIVGKRLERKAENPLKNILEPQQSHVSPTGRLRNKFLFPWYKKKRQNNHKMRN